MCNEVSGGRVSLSSLVKNRLLGRTAASGAHLGLYEHGTYHIFVVIAYKQPLTGRNKELITLWDVTFEFEFE